MDIKEPKIEAIEFVPEVIPVDSDNYQDEFMYGKSIEAIDYNVQIRNKPTSTKKYCFIRNSWTQSISDSTETTVTLGTTETNDSAMTATANKITITAAWQYAISAMIQYAGNSTGIRQLLLINNGNRVTLSNATPNATSINVSISTIVTLALNDVLEIATYQTSGGNLNINASDNVTYFRLHQL